MNVTMTITVVTKLQNGQLDTFFSTLFQLCDVLDDNLSASRTWETRACWHGQGTQLCTARFLWLRDPYPMCLWNGRWYFVSGIKVMDLFRFGILSTSSEGTDVTRCEDILKVTGVQADQFTLGKKMVRRLPLLNTNYLFLQILDLVICFCCFFQNEHTKSQVIKPILFKFDRKRQCSSSLGDTAPFQINK